MKINNFLFAAAVSAVALTTSCEKGPTPESELSSTVKFSSKITDQVLTKATNNTWDNNDAIGVFMKKGTALTNVIAGNKKYVTPNASGNFQAESAAEEISYPADGSQVDFIAYYPYQAAVANNALALNLVDQSQQNQIDVMYSNNAKNFSKTSSNAQLIFNHVLSKVELTVNKGTGVTSLANLNVQFDGFNTKANFDLATGSLTTADAKNLFNAKVTAGADKSVAEAIVLPVASAAGNKIVFKLAQGDFTWTLPTPTAYEAGKKYQYSVTLTTDAAGNNKVSVTSTIVDWTNVPSGNYDIIKDGKDETPTTPTDPGNQEKTLQQIFKETFGTQDVSKTRVKIGDYKDWTVAGNSYSDQFASVDIRSTGTIANHLWFPSGKDGEIKISNINTKGFADPTSFKVNFKISGNQTGSLTYDISNVKITLNGVTVSAKSFNLVAADANKWRDEEVTFDIPKGTTVPENSTLTFSVEGAANKVGIRIGDIALSGLK